MIGKSSDLFVPLGSENYLSPPTRKTKGGQLLISPSLDLLTVVTGPKGGKQVFLKKQDSPPFLESFKATSSVQFSSVAQSCLALCNSMDCSTPGLSVHHQLPEFTQTHVHWVDDAIQPSHPLSSPSYPTFSLCQDQGLFQ